MLDYLQVLPLPNQPRNQDETDPHTEDDHNLIIFFFKKKFPYRKEHWRRLWEQKIKSQPLSQTLGNEKLGKKTTRNSNRP